MPLVMSSVASAQRHSTNTQCDRFRWPTEVCGKVECQPSQPQFPVRDRGTYVVLFFVNIPMV
jgi:hypothetical protein